MRLSLLALLFSACLVFSASRPKYVFLFIGDGMSTPQRMMAEEFSRMTEHGPLTLNRLPFQATTRTCSANSLVTDSAAAGTAIACGEKTNNGMLGVRPDGASLVSLAEVARKEGYKVGIMTTVTICHATPGAFYAHRPNRGQSYEIGLDLIASNFDFFAGGGLGGAAEKADEDVFKGNIYDLAAKSGYKVVKGKAGLESLKKSDGKAWAVCTEGELPQAIDNRGDYPRLCEITAKAIEMLDNRKGFFMMVEGGKIDHAGHANDSATNLREVIDFDDAVRVAVSFMEKHPRETLIVITGDHETGGMSLGFAGSGYAMYLDVLTHQKCSIGDFRQRIEDMAKENPALTFDEIKPIITQEFGLKFSAGDKDRMTLSEAEIRKLSEDFGKKPASIAGDIRQLMANRAGIGWTSGAHTALPVLTTSQGVCADQFTGFIENTDIAKKLKDIFQK